MANPVAHSVFTSLGTELTWAVGVERLAELHDCSGPSGRDIYLPWSRGFSPLERVSSWRTRHSWRHCGDGSHGARSPFIPETSTPPPGSRSRGTPDRGTCSPSAGKLPRPEPGGNPW